MERTYRSWLEEDFVSAQKEYTGPTPLLGSDGTLLCAGWARRNVFDYDRYRVKKPLRRKEWDFYQISDGHYMVQLSFANISLGGYASAVLVDLRKGNTLCSVMAPFLGGKDRYVLPPKGDVPNQVHMEVGKCVFEALTGETRRTLRFTLDDVACDFTMDIAQGQENITTVVPFKSFPDRYFMTTKQNCLPCEGTFRYGEETVTLTKDRTFCVLDWGRVCTPYRLVWYWGNGSTYLTDAEGGRHVFGFEITWGIGDETQATETCVFYDGKPISSARWM